jgi:hypothetical protein
MCDMFGGPSQQEESLGAQQSSLAGDLTAAYHQQLAGQTDALTKLNAQVSRIQSGETGPGFGGSENAARISEIVNQGAALSRNTTQAAQDRGAGQVFGGASDSSGLARTSAINKQISEEGSAIAGAQTSNALIKEQADNFSQGRTNASAAASGFDALAGKYNPLGFAGAAGNEDQAAFNTANTIQQQKVAKAQAIAKLIGSAVTTVATGGIGGLAGGAALGGGLGGFLKAGVNSVAGSNIFGIGGGSGAPGGSDTQTGDGYYD